MLANKIEANWLQLKGLIKERYAKLTDDDLLLMEGKKDQLMGHLQEKVGDTRENIEDFLTKALDSLKKS